MKRPLARRALARRVASCAWLVGTVLLLLPASASTAAAPGDGPKPAQDACSASWLSRLPGGHAPLHHEHGVSRLVDGRYGHPPAGVPAPGVDTTVPGHRGHGPADIASAGPVPYGAAPAFAADGDDDGPHQGAFVIPNDPLFWAGQDNLKLINAPDAWGVSYGAVDVTVAIVSSGIDLDHPDLVDKLWRNDAEVPGNGVDDDGNGYVDDVVGWNFPDDNGVPADFPTGQRGTMSAGIIAAETHNEEGIAGLSWFARLMPLKVFFPDAHGSPRGDPNDVTAAICYAADQGADVIFVEGWFFETSLTVEQIVRMEEAINYAHDAHGAVVVAPAGDCGLADPPAWCPPAAGDVDAPIYPAVFPRVLGVQSVSARTVEQNGNASRGYWVALAAPGWDFMTTFLDDPLYRFISLGLVNEATSNFAAAHVAGAVAVMRGLNPAYSPLQIESVLCSTADRSHGGPYEWDGEREWNERMGCGLLDLEATAENMQWSVRVQPTRVDILSDGKQPAPTLNVSSRYLNRGTWELRSNDAWVSADPPVQDTGGPATSLARFDLDILRQQTGGDLSAGDIFSPELTACALPGHQLDCAELAVRLRIVEALARVYLPVGLR